MREIKFRAWDSNQLPYDKQMLYMEDMTIETIKNEGSYTEKNLNLLTYLSDRYKLMQYTGLKDKNGVEIYEGDICICEGGAEHEGLREISMTLQVKYGGCCFDMVDTSDVGYGWCFSFGVEDVEVIGNIYENKELLEYK